MTENNKSEQLPLHLPVQTASARDDLVVTPVNQKAVEFIDSWPGWPAPIAILAGPVGAGKTHLANIWAASAGARFLAAGHDSEADVPNEGNFIVEDLSQGGFNETWLFHLINSSRMSKGSLLLTSRQWPADWCVALPDLQSRLKTAHVMELHEPDDTMLAGVLIKLFADRQMIVDQPVIDYLVLRMERSLASAQKLVDELDRLSLSQQRAVTKPLASEALTNLGLQD